MEEHTAKYFTTEALARMVHAQGKVVATVICHLWQNRMNPDTPLEIIDNLQLRFSDGTNITIGCDHNSEALDVLDFDYEETAEALKTEFGGKIRLFAVDASSTKMWEDVIGKELHAIKISK